MISRLLNFSRLRTAFVLSATLALFAICLPSAEAQEASYEDDLVAGLARLPLVSETSNPLFWDRYYIRDLGLFVGERETMLLLEDAYIAGNSVLDFDEKQLKSMQEKGTLPPFLLSFQLQQNFEDNPTDAKDATFSWSKDYSADGSPDDYAVDAALIANIYTMDGAIFGMPWLFAYDPERFAYHHRIGVEWDRLETDKGLKDELAYRLEAEFLPGNVLFQGVTNLFGDEGAPDIVRVGAELRQNRVTDEDSWAVDVNYRPAFHLWKDKSQGLGGFFLGRRTYFEDGKPFQALYYEAKEKGLRSEKLNGSNERDITEQPKTFINLSPVITIEEADTAALAARGFDDTTFFAKGAWEASLGLYQERIEIFYKVVALQPLNGVDELYVHQDMGMKFKPVPEGPLSVNLSYKKGEAAPSFGDEDLFTISLGAKF